MTHGDPNDPGRLVVAFAVVCILITIAATAWWMLKVVPQ